MQINFLRLELTYYCSGKIIEYEDVGKYFSKAIQYFSYRDYLKVFFHIK